MLRYLLVAFLLFPNILCAAQQTVSSGTGVYWSTEKDKINANFTELYGKIISSVTLSDSVLTVTLADASYVEVDLSESIDGWG